jgi:hypothetical protein
MKMAVPAVPPAHFLGDFYSRWCLDCLVEIARAVSADYFANPEYYQGDDAPDEMVDMWISYGCVPSFPNTDQRNTMAAAILGSSDGYASQSTSGGGGDSFHQNRGPLFAACIAAETSSAAQNRASLEQQVTVALPAFRNYLIAFQGKAAGVSHQRVRSISEVAFEILRSDTVFSRFTGKRANAISNRWPLQEDDPGANILVPEILARLEVQGVDPNLQFPLLRAMAQAGQEAIEEIARVPNPARLGDLIKKTYSWAVFTQSYSGKSS